LAVGLGAIGSAIGEGMIAMRAVEALGRQPRCSGKLLRVMLIGQAVTETSAIFALVVSFILLFQGKGDMAIKAYAFLAAGLCIGVGALGSGLGVGLTGSAASEGVGKQPENSEVLTFHMLIGQAVAETSAIFSLTITLILIMFTAELSLIKICAVLGAGIASGFGGVGPAIGIGYVGLKANQAVAKDPRNVGLITKIMLIGQAATQTTSIYSVIVALILIFII
ncbi:ATP synthase F0 subunit C, partial [Thermoproteota archaeon]